MDFKKTITVAAALMIFGAAPVNAGWPEKIDGNIAIAQQKFDEARENLKRVAGVLLEIFENDKHISMRHEAEKQIKIKYPAEYGEYIVARMDLDDMQNLRYVASMNAIGEEEQNG